MHLCVCVCVHSKLRNFESEIQYNHVKGTMFGVGVGVENGKDAFTGA